ncbi:RagB/SusD family nutrient uptake outer membrane protein [Sphingobacterium hungaricum]|uniref:RagB/SusD family nutrient uptake outer membrane protein n=1 Tax=Sphingobacterium hungaricum TaxID=2082723 RepID=A0A928UZ55_9SPHI|nr:RagB/SusD family nutrient uptake outer membrane protein [Sphingobacterium hungaricum]MBE8714051.1 RagB/SusD family nutrient uptake outer membrane protein [Sphingobacterium hungaricum]
MKNYIIKYVLIASILFAGCSDLVEELKGETSRGSIGESDMDALMEGMYVTLRSPYQGMGAWWALQQATSDETITPTRAGDWDDNGAWRALFLHKWQIDHGTIENVYKVLNSVSYAATDILGYSPTTQQEAEARFVRAFVQFDILDGWGQVPYRDAGEDITLMSRVRQAPEQIDYLIAELDEITSNLPTNSNKLANQDAAKMLKMKIYLNKGAILSRDNPTFDNGDMAQVITLANEIIATNKYSLEANYFDNFAVDNGSSSELIFVSDNVGGTNAGSLQSMWRVTTHYNMNPSGWNGFATLSDFYDKFESTDQRRGGPYPGMTEVGGVNMGFLIGQQYDQNGVALKDRRGNNLSFTREVSLIERGNNLEVTGIRVMKYEPDYVNLSNELPDNEWVFYRYSDVLLMKAEALLRQGNAAEALILVNQVRTARGASLLAAITLDGLLDELGREFFWEAHRRTDLIRFGKYLLEWQEKPADDDNRALWFPIPQSQIGNTNYIQNPGY